MHTNTSYTVIFSYLEGVFELEIILKFYISTIFAYKKDIMQKGKSYNKVEAWEIMQQKSTCIIENS